MRGCQYEADDVQRRGIQRAEEGHSEREVSEYDGADHPVGRVDREDPAVLSKRETRTSTSWDRGHAADS